MSRPEMRRHVPGHFTPELKWSNTRASSKGCLAIPSHRETRGILGTTGRPGGNQGSVLGSSRTQDRARTQEQNPGENHRQTQEWQRLAEQTLIFGVWVRVSPLIPSEHLLRGTTVNNTTSFPLTRHAPSNKNVERAWPAWPVLNRKTHTGKPRPQNSSCVSRSAVAVCLELPGGSGGGGVNVVSCGFKVCLFFQCWTRT